MSVCENNNDCSGNEYCPAQKICKENDVKNGGKEADDGSWSCVGKKKGEARTRICQLKCVNEESDLAGSGLRMCPNANYICKNERCVKKQGGGGWLVIVIIIGFIIIAAVLSGRKRDRDY